MFSPDFPPVLASYKGKQGGRGFPLPNPLPPFQVHFYRIRLIIRRRKKRGGGVLVRLSVYRQEGRGGGGVGIFPTESLPPLPIPPLRSVDFRPLQRPKVLKFQNLLVWSLAVFKMHIGQPCRAGSGPSVRQGWPICTDSELF